MSLPSDSKLLDCTGRGNILVLTLHTSSHWHLKKTGLSQSAPQASPDSLSEVKAEGLILGLMPFPSYQLIAFPSSVSPNKVRHQILNVLTELLCPSAHAYPCPFGSTIMLSSGNSEGICSGLSSSTFRPSHKAPLYTCLPALPFTCLLSMAGKPT